jgi:hypothetical protein
MFLRSTKIIEYRDAEMLRLVQIDDGKANPIESANGSDSSQQMFLKSDRGLGQTEPLFDVLDLNTLAED